jgi:protein SCO1/2
MKARHTAALLLLAVVTACSSGSKPLAEISGGQPAGDLRGDVLEPPSPEPAVQLTDTAGASYDLRKATAGKVALVYFGYTHCPDICPTFMADVAQALRESTAAVRSRVDVIFISVDPRRDSGQTIRRWLDNFNPHFVGLRGSIHQIIQTQRAMGVPASRVKPHSKHGYTVEHSAELLAYTPDRVGHVLYTEGPTTISDLRHDLAILTTSTAYA